MRKSLILLAALSLFALACDKNNEPDTPVVIPKTLTIKGEGCEWGNIGREMRLSSEGCWVIYGDFTTGQGPLVRLYDQDSNLVYKAKAPKSGLYRLEYNYNRDYRPSWVAIDRVSLLLAEGAAETQESIEVKYIGDGSWKAGPVRVKKEQLRFRYELETSKPGELSTWCASWDKTGVAPESLSADYLAPRELGEEECTKRYISGSRACWMLPSSIVPSIDTLVINLNDGPAQEVIVVPEPGHKGPGVIFIGDSITWQWTRDGVGHPTYFTDRGWVNQGISGNTTTQMLDRFRKDVIAEDPQIVVIEGGTNDIANSVESSILGRLQTMAELAWSAGIKVVMGSVPPCNEMSSLPDFHPEDRIINLNNMIKAYSESMGFPYADYYSVLVDENKGLKADYQKDAIHPNADGYTAMEGVIQPIIEELLAQ